MVRSDGMRSNHPLQLGWIGVRHASTSARNPAVVDDDVDKPERADHLAHHSLVVLERIDARLHCNGATSELLDLHHGF